MVEGTSMLLMLTVMMLVGSFMAGSIPLVMKLSEEKLRMITILGAGLLVGTALTVIIPEGIHSLYSDVKNTPDAYQHVKNHHIIPEGTVPNIGTAAAVLANIGKDHNPIEGLPNNDMLKAPKQTHLEKDQIYFKANNEDHSRVIGLSLVLGFVFMMLVDQLSQRYQITGDNKKITATLGLVVHAAADGVALGAAATTSHQDVEMIVFLAIMLHKAPAAFGLVSFLLHEKIERQRIRRHLAIFSLSAPLFTVLTYFGIGQKQQETLSEVNATGIAMLFSAGTFLYVATVHVLPELTQSSSGHYSGSSNQFDNAGISYSAVEAAGPSATVQRRSPPTQTHKGLRNSELVLMIFGTLIPLVITFGHSH